MFIHYPYASKCMLFTFVDLKKKAVAYRNHRIKLSVLYTVFVLVTCVGVTKLLKKTKRLNNYSRQANGLWSK